MVEIKALNIDENEPVDVDAPSGETVNESSKSTTEQETQKISEPEFDPDAIPDVMGLAAEQRKRLDESMKANPPRWFICPQL